MSPTDPKRLAVLQQLASEEQSLRRRGYRDSTYTDMYRRARSILNSAYAQPPARPQPTPSNSDPAHQIQQILNPGPLPSDRHADEMQRYADLASSPVYPDSFRETARSAASEARAHAASVRNTHIAKGLQSYFSAPPIPSDASLLLREPLSVYQAWLQHAQALQRSARWTTPLR
jgi:hypothetical protein